MTALYRRLLGQTFDVLPPVLHRFHEHPTGARGRGRFQVTHGPGWLRSRLAGLARLPPAGDDVPLDLCVEVDGPRERWIRRFGAREFTTVQWVERSWLIEASGPLRFAFVVEADDRGMRFALERCWVLGLRLPPVLTPRVGTTAVPEGNGWRVDVRIEVPLLGLLCRYQGRLDPV